MREDRIARATALAVCFCILVGLGWLFAKAFIAESETRLEHLRIHRQAQVERAIK